MENRKQTAVEWLIYWMGKNQYFIGNDLLQAVNQAMQMEKEQCEEYASQQLAEKDKEIERYKEVLTELVELKKMKDSQGKTFIYCDRQPKAWQQAFDLIKSLNK